MQDIRIDITLNTAQPITFTHHGIGGLPTMVRGVDSEGKPLRTVYIPAAQFRGRLRHESALAKMRAATTPIKLADAYMLALGQNIDTKEDEADEKVRLGELLALRAANPFIDLFGTWKMDSRLYVSHLLPAMNVQPDTFHHIRRDLDTNEALFAELPEAETGVFYARQDGQSQASQAEGLIKVATREMRKAKKDNDAEKLAEIEAKIEQLKALKKAHKAGDESGNTKHLVEMEAIPAGLQLLGKLIVKRATAQDVSTITGAFNAISLFPMFGAQRARGCGEVSGTADVCHTSGEVLAHIAFGGFSPALVEWTDAGTAFMTPADPVAVAA